MLLGKLSNGWRISAINVLLDFLGDLLTLGRSLVLGSLLSRLFDDPSFFFSNFLMTLMIVDFETTIPNSAKHAMIFLEDRPFLTWTLMAPQTSKLILATISLGIAQSEIKTVV
jgi:hypothetical protein